MYFLYLLRCNNQSLYCGYTQDFAHRLNQHISGKGGAKYTRSFPPIGIEMAWQVFLTQKEVMQLEHKIKQQPKASKESLIRNPDQLYASLDQMHLCPASLEVISNDALKALWQEACYAA